MEVIFYILIYIIISIFSVFFLANSPLENATKQTIRWACLPKDLQTGKLCKPRWYLVVLLLPLILILKALGLVLAH